MGNMFMFNPYAENGGSIVAVAGANYAIIAADTRLTADNGLAIYTREQKRLFKLADFTVLGSGGCWCDTLELVRLVKARVNIYQLDNNDILSTPAAAQMLSIMLYYKRFMPYMVSNIIAGLDDEGKGCVFSFDPLGHYARSHCAASGWSKKLMQPFLDSQFGLDDLANVTETTMTKEEALVIIKDAFTVAAEREIRTGDSIYISIITERGIVEEKFALRKD